MLNKLLPFLLLFTISTNLYSQLIITEVYYDTPYYEKFEIDEKTQDGQSTGNIVPFVQHHRGEFIEIYNYSDKDVNMLNWFLRDNAGVYWLPNKIIKKGTYIVFAYSSLPYNNTPFTEYFYTTAGKDSQVVLQDKIILRNKREKLTLGYTVGGIQNNIDKSTIFWDFSPPPLQNYKSGLTQNPQQFYTVPSFQLGTFNNGSGLYDLLLPPNPLEANFVPPTHSYDDLIKNDYQQYYSFLDWSENVNNIISMVCPINIERVSQNINQSGLSNTVQCFNYDANGNIISSYNCSDEIIPPGESNGFTADEINTIKNNIIISPNPTKASDSYNVTLTWNGPALDKINNIQIFNSVGNTVYGFAPGQGVNTTTFNLQNQLPGAFIANFVLNTGQVISKNILKW